MREDFYHFDGNAQGLRLVSKLHFLVDERGMNLTYALLNTIIKYPVSSLEMNGKSGDIKDKKLGFYFADKITYTCDCTNQYNGDIKTIFKIVAYKLFKYILDRKCC